MGKTNGESLLRISLTQDFFNAVEAHPQAYPTVAFEDDHFWRTTHPEQAKLVGMLGILAMPQPKATSRTPYATSVFYEGGSDAAASAYELVHTARSWGSDMQQAIAAEQTAPRMPQLHTETSGIRALRPRLVGGVAVFAAHDELETQVFYNHALRLDVTSSLHRERSQHPVSIDRRNYIHQICTRQEVGRQAATDITALTVLNLLAEHEANQNNVESNTALMLQ